MNGWRTGFFVAHVVQGILLFVLLWHYDFVRASSTVPGSVFALIGQQIPSDRIKEAIEHPDALKIAYDVGVLELLSLGLTLFSITIAILAVFGFWMIRAAALKAAADAAAPEAAKMAKQVAQEWIEKNAPQIFDQATVARGISKPAVALTSAEQDEIIAKASEIKADG